MLTVRGDACKDKELDMNFSKNQVDDNLAISKQMIERHAVPRPHVGTLILSSTHSTPPRKPYR